MKKQIIFLMLLTATIANAQVSKLDQIFDTYQEAKGVTSIKIAKPMFDMINKLNLGGDEINQIKPLLSKINSIKMLIVENKDNQYSKVQDEVKKAFSKIKYDELMTVNSDNNRIRFLVENITDNVMNNLLLDISSDSNTVFMILDGKIKYDDLNKLLNNK